MPVDGSVRRPSSTPRRPILLLALFLLLTRLPAVLYPKAIDDEQVYAVVARQMLHGGKPYRDAIERKPPLLFELYKGIFVVAGPRNWPAIHVTVVAWTGATMLVLYLIAARLFDAAAGFWAAFLYALFSAWGDYRSLALNGELLMNLPIVVALAIAFDGARTKARLDLVLAGVAIALACLLKQPAGIATMPIGLYLLRRDYRRQRNLGVAHSIGHAVLFSAGFFATLAIAAVVLWREGILEEAVYWTVLDHRLPSGVGAMTFVWNALGPSAYFVASTLPLLLGAAWSLGRGCRREACWRDRSAEFAALWMLLAASAVAVSVTAQFSYHYYLQLLPPLAVLAAPFFATAHDAASTRFFLLRPPSLQRWLATTALVFLVVDAIEFVIHSPLSEAAVYVRDHSAPEDRIFVWGQGDRQTGMYLDADRLAASRYIATFPLTGHVFATPDTPADPAARSNPQAWANLQRDFAAHPPRFIIDTDWIRGDAKYPIARYPVMSAYLADHYREAIRAGDGIVYQRAD